MILLLYCSASSVAAVSLHSAVPAGRMQHLLHIYIAGSIASVVPPLHELLQSSSSSRLAFLANCRKPPQTLNSKQYAVCRIYTGDLNCCDVTPSKERLTSIQLMMYRLWFAPAFRSSVLTIQPRPSVLKQHSQNYRERLRFSPCVYYMTSLL